MDEFTNKTQPSRDKKGHVLEPKVPSNQKHEERTAWENIHVHKSFLSLLQLFPPQVQKGEPPQQPICILNIVLPDDIVCETISLTDSESIRKKYYANENFDYYRQDPRLADMSNLLGEDWVEVANQLGLTTSEINVIKSEYPDSVAKQAQSMLRMWLSQSGNKVQTNTLENALHRIGRGDIINQCLNLDNRNQDILRIRSEEKVKQRLIDDTKIKDKSSPEKFLNEEKGEFEIIFDKTFNKSAE